MADSDFGSEYEEAQKNSAIEIINVNQFFPTLDGKIQVYSDHFSYLADNKATSSESWIAPKGTEIPTEVPDLDKQSEGSQKPDENNELISGKKESTENKLEEDTLENQEPIKLASARITSDEEKPVDNVSEEKPMDATSNEKSAAVRSDGEVPTEAISKEERPTETISGGAISKEEKPVEDISKEERPTETISGGERPEEATSEEQKPIETTSGQEKTKDLEDGEQIEDTTKEKKLPNTTEERGKQTEADSQEIQEKKDSEEFDQDKQLDILPKSCLPEPEQGDDSEAATVFPTELDATVKEEYDEAWTGNRKLESLKSITEKNAAEHYKEAGIALKNNKLEEALQQYEKCLAMRPNVSLYYIQRAEIYFQMCDFQSAILNYRKACILEPNNKSSFDRLAFIHIFQGQTLFDQKNYTEALESFTRASEMQPDNVTYQTRSITCLAALQRHGECLALVNRRLESEQQNADLFVMRARLHFMFRNYTLCYYDLKDAISMEAGHVEAVSLLNKLEERARQANNEATHLSLNNRTREALSKVSIAIEMDPAVAEYHVRRGALHRRLGDFNAAIDDYLLALDKCEHDEYSSVYKDAQRQLLLTFNDFAVECYQRGYYDEAILLLDKSIKAEKKERSLYINRGDCFYQRGDYQYALQDYHQALDLDKYDDSIRARISYVHHQIGQQAMAIGAYRSAESSFGEALAANPTVSHLWVARARCRYQAESIGTSRQDLVMALALNPNQDDVASLISRLFPGKTVAEVLTEKTMSRAKEELQQMLAAVRPDDSQLMAAAAASLAGSNLAARTQSAVSAAPKTAPMIMKPCTTNGDLFRVMIKEKLTLGREMKQLYHERPSLWYSGGRVQAALPPASDHVQRGVARNGKMALRSVDSRGRAVPEKATKTGWRTFGTGIGIK